MNRLEVRGVIVPSSYDSEWANEYITKGIMIPESRFRDILSKCSKTEALELYINSPGGSVFSGNEMINAVNAWIKETGQPVEITVGAMAASMAAAMVINTNAAKVRVHKNSKLMFHGAWTNTEGGSQAHKDEAELLDKINNDIKTTLVSRYKLSPEKVDEWFAEGRAGWLAATDAKDAGIASEIIDVDDKPHKLNKTVSTMLSERGLKLAAILESEVMEVESEAGKDGATGKTDSNTSDAKVPVAESEKTGQETVAGVEASNGSEKRSDNVMVLTDRIRQQEQHISELNTIMNEWKQKNEKLIKECKDWQARYDKSLADAKKMEKDFAAEKELLAERQRQSDSRIEGLESRLTRFTLDATALDSSPTVTSWESAKVACNGDVAMAMKKYPEIHREYLKAERNRKGKTK